MGSVLSLGGFGLDIAIHTCQGIGYHATNWQKEDGRYVARGLVYGPEGQREAAPHAAMQVHVLEAGEGRLRFQVTSQHERALKAVKITLDLPYMPMLAPEEIDLPQATWRGWDFPRDWRTGFAVWQRAGAAQPGQRYFTVLTKETPWRFKRLRALRMGDRMRLEIIQDANLRDRTFKFESSVWELTWRDEIETTLDDYARFVRQSHGALSFAQRKDMPEWARHVGLVINLHGCDWNGGVDLDCAAMTRVCEVFKDLFPPEKTLLYPIGWDGPYMRFYPDFEAGAATGGHEGFQAFCQRARQLGFHVMPHLNAMAVNMRHRHFLEHLKDYVIRDYNGLPRHSYHIDWDFDGLGDSAHAYIALEPPGLREILCDVVDRLVRDYGIDGVFLDETCNVFYNDPAWDQVEGVRRLIRDLHERQPNVLIAGEEWNEMLLAMTPIVQVWEYCSDGLPGFGRHRSPLLRNWAAQFIRSCGYLAMASPDGERGVHEWPDVPWVDEDQVEPFYIPTVAITRHTLERGMDGIRKVVARAHAYAKQCAGR